MRYGKNEIHSAVWERVYDMPDGFDHGVRIGEKEAMSEVERAGAFGTNPVRWAKRIFVVLSAIGALGFFISPTFGVVMVATLFGGAGIVYIVEALGRLHGMQYRPPTYSATSLETVVAHVQPDSMVQTYIKSLIAVGESAAIADYDRRAAITELNLLMNEYVRIEAVRQTLLRERDTHSLGEEIEQISQQLAQTNDAATVESLGQSLSIARHRQKREQGSIALLRRIDAELMLLRQLLGQLRESVTAEQPVSVDFSEIRERLAAITSRTDETERAREELDRAI